VQATPPRFTLAVLGTRVRVSAGLLTWLVVAAVAALLDREGSVAPLLGVAALVLSMVVHEGAHAVVAHNLGYRVEWVVLGGLAGVTAWFGRDDRPLERAAVALAGPAASAGLVLLFLILWRVVPAGSWAVDAVYASLLVNVVALVANLVPVGGTDGALLLRGLAEHARLRRP
jgi:Zn-dependent protease